MCPVLPTGVSHAAHLDDKSPLYLLSSQVKCTYRNSSGTDIQRFIHRVTIPPVDLDYQILLDVSGDGIEEAQTRQHKNNGGKYGGDYSLARMGNSVVVLVRKGSWVWSNYLLL